MTAFTTALGMAAVLLVFAAQLVPVATRLDRTTKGKRR